MTVSVQLELEASPANALERRYREWRATEVGRWVYDVFKSFAVERMDRDQRFGVKALAERVRWEVSYDPYRIRYHEFKLNNSYVAYIARDLIREYPRLKDLIEVRRVKGDD